MVHQIPFWHHVIQNVKLGGKFSAMQSNLRLVVTKNKSVR